MSVITEVAKIYSTSTPIYLGEISIWHNMCLIDISPSTRACWNALHYLGFRVISFGYLLIHIPSLPTDQNGLDLSVSQTSFRSIWNNPNNSRVDAIAFLEQLSGYSVLMAMIPLNVATQLPMPLMAAHLKANIPRRCGWIYNKICAFNRARVAA